MRKLNEELTSLKETIEELENRIQYLEDYLEVGRYRIYSSDEEEEEEEEDEGEEFERNHILVWKKKTCKPLYYESKNMNGKPNWTTDREEAMAVSWSTCNDVRNDTKKYCKTGILSVEEF